MRTNYEKEYRIKIMAQDGRYGLCERCGKPCVPHYAQQWRYKDRINHGWSVAGFGHIECLKKLDWSDAPVVGDL